LLLDRYNTFNHKKASDVEFLQQTSIILKRPATATFQNDCDIFMVKKTDEDITESDNITEYLDTGEILAFIQGERWTFSINTKVQFILDAEI